MALQDHDRTGSLGEAAYGTQPVGLDFPGRDPEESRGLARMGRQDPRSRSVTQVQ